MAAFIVICRHLRRGWCWSYMSGGGCLLSQCGAGGLIVVVVGGRRAVVVLVQVEHIVDL